MSSRDTGGTHTNEVTRTRLEREGSTLTPQELEAVDERMKLRPLAVYELVRQEGESELTRPVASLWWSGLAAGLSIGFSLFTEAALRAHLPDAPWRPLIENWGYSVGFLIVILARQQLFTEITLTATLPVLARPKWRGVGAILRLWCVVFLANMVGTAIFGAAMSVDVLGLPELTEAAVSLSREAMAPGPWHMLLRGIAAGWLMATIVWLLPSAETAGILVIATITYLIALFELSHIVAGSVEAFLLVFRGEIGVGTAILSFHMPTLAGNILGGSALFALLSYAQVARELDERGN